MAGKTSILAGSEDVGKHCALSLTFSAVTRVCFHIGVFSITCDPSNEMEMDGDTIP